MFTFKIALLILALIAASVVGARNIKRDFKPAIRAHFELFLAGLPIGFLFPLLPLPLQIETLWLAIASGLLTGAIVSFSLPRQWRYARRSHNAHSPNVEHE